MVIALPAVIIFGLVSWLLLRSRMIRPLEAVIVGLFGFFLAATTLGHGLATFMDDVFGAHHTVTVGPTQPGPTTLAPVVPPSPRDPGVPGQPPSKGGVQA